jgi:hypothetical protein
VPSDVTVDVYNGNPAVNGLAAQVSQALAALGYKAGKTGNSAGQTQTVQPATQLFYGAGAAANAQQIAIQFGVTAKALSTLPADHVEVLIGSTVTVVPAGITPTPAPTADTPSVGPPSAGPQPTGPQSAGAQVIGAQAAATPSASPTPSSTTGAGSGGTGGLVTVAPNAPYGIPCVY